MSYSWLSLAALFLVFVLWRIALPIFTGRGRREYERREALFTAAEFRFLQALRSALPPGLEIFGKVRVADVLRPIERLSPKVWRRAFYRISSKHFDFVLCDRGSGKAVCAIELNDRSHARAERRERDALIARACSEAEFPLLVVNVSRSYDVERLGAMIRGVIQAHPTVQGPAALHSGDGRGSVFDD